MNHLVTFSDESMSRSRELCVSSGRKYGASTVYDWTENELQMTLFYKTRSDVLDQKRGIGYWAWKPYIILDRIRSLLDGPSPNHVVIYADAGIEFIAPVSHIISRMDQDVFLFGNNWEHAHWCKADVIEAVWPQPRPTNEERLARILELEQAGRTDILEAVDAILKGEVSDAVLHDILWYQFGKQVQASVIFFRVSDYTRRFVKEWLDWCLFEGGRLIDDSPSRLPNHPEFREHRHDQAILTTMAYREGIKLHYWPGVYNRFFGQEFVYEKLPCYAADTYGPMFHHHRLRNDEWPK